MQLQSTQADFELVDAPEFEVVDDTPFFAPASTDMVDGMIGQYRAERAQVEEIHAFMAPRLEGHALSYFLDGNRSDERGRTSLAMSAKQLFDLEGAIASLNATYWSKTLALTDVLDLMPQKRRDEWRQQIQNPLGTKSDKFAKDYIIPPIPEFEENTVRDTIMGLLNMRSQFLAERVDGIFRALSKTHVTNAPEGFSKRMILSYVTSDMGYADHGKAGVINDLRCVIAKFMGRDEPGWDATSPVIKYARHQRRGEWVTLDGGALRIRCYMVGTAHLEVHPDMAWRLNAILAQLHPLAIPSHFRERPKKKLKDFVLMSRPLPFAVVARLGKLEHARDMNPNKGYRENTWVKVPGCYDMPYGHQADKVVEEEVARVLESLGGLRVEGKKSNRWEFDYPVLEVVQEIVASGCIPDVKAHQFYPTPAALARVLVEMADIGPDHTVLEPSAGQGGLADNLPKDRTTCVEVADLNCRVLEAKGYRVTQADFLSLHTNRQLYNRVVMNPPFSEGRAEAHTLHAAKMLAPGGRLVAILPSGMRGKDIPGLNCHWSKPMANQFPGVSVEVVILTADRPATA